MSLRVRNLNAAETVRWLAHAEIKPKAAAVLIDRGIVYCETVEKYAEHYKVIAELDADLIHRALCDDEVYDFLTVGATVWTGDPDNRSEWAALGRAIDTLDDLLEANQYEYVGERKRRVGDRYEPDGNHRHQGKGGSAVPMVTRLYEAGRGPSYGRALLALAQRHLLDLDVYGFDISPVTYDDMAEAGIANRGETAAFEALGLSLAEAIAARADGITPAGLLMAKRDGVTGPEALDMLRKIPTDWFVDANGTDGTEANVERGDYLRSYYDDVVKALTIHDLWAFATKGWTGSNRLSNWAIPDATIADLHLLAEHGMTLDQAAVYVDPLMTGKADRDWHNNVADHLKANTLPPLVGWGGRGSNRLDAKYIPDIIALHEAGVKASHLITFRNAGCAKIEDVLALARMGVDHKTLTGWLAEHGHQVDPRFKPNKRRLRYAETKRLAMERTPA